MTTRPPRSTPSGVLALAVGLFLSACGGDVSIGVSTSTSYMDAARLAVADVTASGSARVDTVMIPEGTNQATPAIAAAERFAAHANLVAVVGHSNSSASLATSGIYNQLEVVQLTPTSSATIYSEAGPYSFRLVPSDDHQARFLVEQLAAAWPTGARVAVGYVNDDYGRGLRDGVRLGAADSPLDLVLELPYAEEAFRHREVEHFADAVAAVEPDAILWLGRASTLDRFLPGLHQAAPAAIILGSDALAAAREMSQDSRWSGVRYVDFLDLESGPELQDFAARYQARFGRRATAPDALTYDATRLILAAIADGARTGPALREYLHSLGRDRPPYPGITGPIAFDENGDIHRDYVLVTLP